MQKIAHATRFFLNSMGTLLSTLEFLGGLYNFCNLVVIFKMLSWANSLIANNNIRSVILEIKNNRCKIVKILIFCSLSQEHFQSK